MKNIRGKDGIINHTGCPGSPSELVDCRSDTFWDNIEEGIISTVRILVEKGFYTVSSCQGHLTSCPIRCVSVIGEIEDIRWFQYAVAEINRSLAVSRPIQYFLLEKQKKFTLYDGLFSNPQIIEISFGHFQHRETETKQKAFEEYIRTHDFHKIHSPLDEKLVDPYLQQGTHCDVFI